MTTKKIILLTMAALVTMHAMAQKEEQKKDENAVKIGDNVKIKPYGFVRNYFTYDSRKMYTVIGGEYSVLPYQEDWNMTEAEATSTGLERTDLNAVGDAKLLAISTRFGLNLEGPEVFGARTSGKIEADFGGFGTTNNVLRIRHAYVKLNWLNQKDIESELLVGQAWHPLSGDIMPEVLGMAAGAPFRPHSRTPQVRYIMTTSSGFGFTASALYQLQYMNNGPSWNGSTWTSTNSTDFANHAIYPECFLGLNYKNQNIYLQLGADIQPLRPRTYGIVNNGGKNYKVDVDEMLISLTPTVYFQFSSGLFAFKSRYLLASNTSHLNMLNGYAVVDSAADGSWKYAPICAHVAYANFAYGKKIRTNLFFGYMKNIGATENLYRFADGYHIYLKGGNNFTKLDGIFRVAPSISYNLKYFNIGLEYEATFASYGDIDLDGSIINNDNLHTIANHRVCVLVKYNF